MFSLFKKKATSFFTEVEQQKIVDAIQHAEKQTSGEVRVYTESKCRFVDPLDRALEVFHFLKMGQTEQRNAVLIYVAMKDKQLAVFGDAGIHETVGKEFWQKEVNLMLSHFNKENYAEGIASVVTQIGAALQHHFPYDGAIDKNELPDEIVFGK